MNDEAAESRGPSGPPPDVPTSPAPDPASSTADEKLDEPPPAWAPPAGGVGEADAPPPPPPGAGLPPRAGGPSFSRDQLVRPRQGRYVAGVCTALGRATNTDPVLWRVLLAVLGVLTGVGVLLYLVGWLFIPAEGDTASPIESLLGKGRSGMAPLSVILLGAGAVLSFAFIVNDGMRASLLATAVILGAVVLIKRGGTHTGRVPAAFPFGGSPAPGPVPDVTAPTAFAADHAPVTEPLTTPLPPAAPQFTTPAGGYRPPFAPHGPYAGPPHPPYPPGLEFKAPKPPRERSRLGRLTFFAVVVVIGAMALIDQAGASIAISAYFAAALVTIGLGLIVGAWFGRARGLIALALITTLGLVASTGTERWGGEIGNSVYRPATLGAIADRYDFTAGDATLDLRGVDFDKQQQAVTVTMRFGRLRVLLPGPVDTTTTLRVDHGRATVLGRDFDDGSVDDQSVSDLGADGPGGGQLTLDLQMDTGTVEVAR